MKVNKSKDKPCSLSECLNNEEGKCSLTLPCFTPKYNDKSCIYYDNNFHKSCQEHKKAGGVLGEYMRKYGRLSDSEVKQIKTEKRKSKKEKKKK